MAKIKISDLSIGDWVMFTPNKKIYVAEPRFTSAPAKITGAYRGREVILEIGCKREFMAIPLSCIEPIPLTPETLEKNGFGKVEPQWYMCEHNGIHISVIVWKNQRGRIEISYKSPFDDDNPLYIADFTANIPHIAVHHLQRILQLAGVEKEIEL